MFSVKPSLITSSCFVCDEPAAVLNDNDSSATIAGSAGITLLSPLKSNEMVPLLFCVMLSIEESR